MDNGTATHNSAASDHYSEARTWLLLPTWLILAFLVVTPTLIMLVYSFLTKEFRGGVIWDFSLAAYERLIFDRGLFGDEPRTLDWTYINIFWRSIWQAGTATVLSLAIGFPTAFFIATRPERIRPVWLFLITIPYWVNLLIRTVSLRFMIRDNGPVNDLLMSMGLIDSPLHLVNTNFAIQLGLFYSYLPFMVLPIYAAIERFDFRLSEAAQDLYASKWATLRRIVLPAVRPGVLAGCVLVFVPSLGSFLVPDLLGGAKTFMIGSLIEEQFKGNAGDWPFGAAVSTVLLTVVLIILLQFARQQKKSEKGLRP